MYKALLLATVVAFAGYAHGADFIDAWISVRLRTPTASRDPTYCPSWTFPQQEPFFNMTVNGTASPTPWMSAEEMQAKNLTSSLPTSHFYFKLDSCARLQLPNDSPAAAVGVLADSLAPYSKFTIEADKLRMLYVCNPTCTSCTVNTTFTVGTCSVDETAVFFNSVANANVTVLFSVPRPPVSHTVLATGLSAAGQYQLTGKVPFAPVTAVYSGVSDCSGEPSYYRLGAAVGPNGGADCYSPTGVLSQNYIAAICSNNGAQLTVRQFPATESSCTLNKQATLTAIAANDLAAVGGVNLITPQSTVLPSAVVGTLPNVRECQASSCGGSYRISSITFCPAAISVAASVSRPGNVTVLCATVAPTTAAPTGSSSLLLGSLTLVASALLALLAF